MYCLSGIKFWSIERNIENSMSHLYVNRESDSSQKNTCQNEVSRSTMKRN